MNESYVLLPQWHVCEEESRLAGLKLPHQRVPAWLRLRLTAQPGSLELKPQVIGGLNNAIIIIITLVDVVN